MRGKSMKNEPTHLTTTHYVVWGKAFNYTALPPKVLKTKRLQCNQCHHEFDWPKKFSTRNTSCPVCQWHNCHGVK